VPPSQFAVAVTTVNGGVVVSSPAGIDCGATCTASFATGSTLTLSATPPIGKGFVGWSGDCVGVSPVCTVTVSKSLKVKASFQK
jgi:uncharacterized repeat protein (TIGR02543 family)